MARTIDEMIKLTLGDLFARNLALTAENEQLREALAAAQGGGTAKPVEAS